MYEFKHRGNANIRKKTNVRMIPILIVQALHSK